MGKFTKLSKIRFSVECFTAGFLQFSGSNVKTCPFGGRLGTRNKIEAFQGFY